MLPVAILVGVVIAACDAHRIVRLKVANAQFRREATLMTT